jgi:4-hydroxy-tetrahydrodipicolinate reductase
MTTGVTVAPSLEKALAAPSDVVVDYTKPDVVKANTLLAISKGRHVVIGTSGLGADDYAEIDNAARAKGVGVLAAGNFSITATLLKRFALMAAKYVPDVEIIDYASARKPDAPSGTARELAERLAEVRRAATSLPQSQVSGVPGTRGAAVGQGEGVQVHALRMPSYILSCEAVFGLPDERLLGSAVCRGHAAGHSPRQLYDRAGQRAGCPDGVSLMHVNPLLTMCAALCPQLSHCRYIVSL